ncbi:hypothetical protein AB3S75_041897 [Citrus x aurantiifolia]
MIVRLEDDLGTSSDELKRGDVPKSIQCYMHETGVSEDEAREHIRDLIAETWTKMNSARFGNPPYLPDVFIEIAMNLVRMSQCMYLLRKFLIIRIYSHVLDLPNKHAVAYYKTHDCGHQIVPPHNN